MTNLLFHFLPLSSIKSRNMLSVRGGVRGGSKIFIQFLGVSNHFGKLTKKIWKIFKVPNFDKDRQTLLDALLSNFFTVFAMEDKGKKVFTYCLSFLEEIGMSIPALVHWLLTDPHCNILKSTKLLQKLGFSQKELTRVFIVGHAWDLIQKPRLNRRVSD